MSLLSLPKLSDRTAELAFTHKSYYHAGYAGDEPRDWERLAFVGEAVLLSTVSKLLYRLLPVKRGAALKRGRVKLMSKECLAMVTDQYGWMKHIRCSEGDRPNIVQSVDNRAAVVESYLGGLALEYGSAPAEEWAQDLVVTALRRFLIEEGADVGVILGMVQEVELRRSAPPPETKVMMPGGDKPQPRPPAEPDRRRSREWTAGSRNSDVDGDPMDIDGQSSGSERNLPPAYTPASATRPPPTTSTNPNTASQRAGTPHASYPSHVSPANVVPIYDPSLPANGFAAGSSRQYLSAPTSSQYASFSSSSTSRSVYSQAPTPTTTPSSRRSTPVPGPRPTVTLVDKSSILKGALAKLNERAKTRFTTPEWTLTSDGQGQLTVWTAKLYLQNKGYVCEGQGQSKQIAKELAAKTALERLKWHDRPW